MELIKNAVEGFPDKSSNLYMPHIIGKVSYGEVPVCIISINVFVGIVEKMTRITTTTDVVVNNGRGEASVSSTSHHAYKVRLLDAEGDYFHEIEFPDGLSPAVGDEITLWYLVREQCVQEFISKKSLAELSYRVAINKSNRHYVDRINSFGEEIDAGFGIIASVVLGFLFANFLARLIKVPDAFAILAGAVVPIYYILKVIKKFKVRSKFRTEMHDFTRREISSL